MSESETAKTLDTNLTTVTIGDNDIDFKHETESFNQYLNEMTQNDKINPAFNFLMRTVVDEHKDSLKKIILKGTLVNGSLALTIAGVLAEQYNEGVTVSLKKRKS